MSPDILEIHTYSHQRPGKLQVKSISSDDTVALQNSLTPSQLDDLADIWVSGYQHHWLENVSHVEFNEIWQNIKPTDALSLLYVRSDPKQSYQIAGYSLFGVFQPNNLAQLLNRIWRYSFADQSAKIDGDFFLKRMDGFNEAIYCIDFLVGRQARGGIGVTLSVINTGLQILKARGYDLNTPFFFYTKERNAKGKLLPMARIALANMRRQHHPQLDKLGILIYKTTLGECLFNTSLPFLAPYWRMYPNAWIRSFLTRNFHQILKRLRLINH